jgi:hypothetical protein
VTKQGWDLPYNLEKYCTGFKLGNRVVFKVAWGGTNAWNMRFKLPEEVAKSFKGQSWECQRYDSTFHESTFRSLKPDSPDSGELRPLFIAAYQHERSPALIPYVPNIGEYAGNRGRVAPLGTSAGIHSVTDWLIATVPGLARDGYRKNSPTWIPIQHSVTSAATQVISTKHSGTSSFLPTPRAYRRTRRDN